jgi:UDP-N-acetylglucosamine 2-epimerase (non-hydrolysing)
VVQGDTTTTFAAAWVAFHERIRIAHIEAGLRTGDKSRPFPEEMNRRLTTTLADLHFAPTARAAENLRHEGVAASRIHVTGNTVVDAVQMILKRPVRFSDKRLNHLPSPTLLVTAHRRESFGEPLREICRAVTQILRAHPEATAVFPVHRNPAVRHAVHRVLQGTPRLILTDPLPYLEFVHLMKRSTLILTDSGGVQEEAPSLGAPVLVLRDVTERPEAVASGWAQLVGTSRERIVAAARDILRGRKTPRRSARNPFGDGRAGQRIARILARFPAGVAAARQRT